jgi:phosphocarrier protein HPr
MQQEDLTITNTVGLHARPASLFVQTSNKFSSDIVIKYDNKSANAKSILQVLSLGVQKDGKISLKITGEDEVQALNALRGLVADNFGEQEPDP